MYCIDHLVKSKGKDLIIGTPLGIGKPNPLLNAIWKKAKADKNIDLDIFTALSIAIPNGKSLLEKRFLEPFKKDTLIAKIQNILT